MFSAKSYGFAVKLTVLTRISHSHVMVQSPHDKLTPWIILFLSTCVTVFLRFRKQK